MLNLLILFITMIASVIFIILMFTGHMYNDT